MKLFELARYRRTDGAGLRRLVVEVIAARNGGEATSEAYRRTNDLARDEVAVLTDSGADQVWTREGRTAA